MHELELDCDELVHLSEQYSNYVVEFYDDHGDGEYPVCIMEFYDNEY